MEDLVPYPLGMSFFSQVNRSFPFGAGDIIEGWESSALL